MLLIIHTIIKLKVLLCEPLCLRVAKMGFVVCMYRQYLAVCVCRMQRVSRKPFDMPQQIIQIPAELQLYLLLPNTLFSLALSVCLSLSFFLLASEITPSCFTQRNALHTTLVCMCVFAFLCCVLCFHVVVTVILH